MTRAEEVVLYTRPDCHLCDLAGEMLERCDVLWRVEDIETDLELIRKYGTLVPVVYRPDVDKELQWPFNEKSLDTFLELEI